MRFGKTSATIGFAAALLIMPALAVAQEVIFIVRHAEDAPEQEDAPLTRVGRHRATGLARVLADVGIREIYTSEARRTIETAEPIAKALAIEPRALPRRDVAGLVSRLTTRHPQDRVLVVSHSRTIPALLRALGHTEDVVVRDEDHDSAFVLMPRSARPPLVVWLRLPSATQVPKRDRGPAALETVPILLAAAWSIWILPRARWLPIPPLGRILLAVCVTLSLIALAGWMYIVLRAS